MMDALRYREGALGAIWITLGLGNLSMFVSEASFGGGNPLLLSAAVSLGSGSTLFLVGVLLTPAGPLGYTQLPLAALPASAPEAVGAYALLRFGFSISARACL